MERQTKKSKDYRPAEDVAGFFLHEEPAAYGVKGPFVVYYDNPDGKMVSVNKGERYESNRQWN
jgi:hypothetical protein